MMPGPIKQYDIRQFMPHANTDPAQVAALRDIMNRKGMKGEVVSGETCGLRWIATQDDDGQIECSFSTAKERPKDFQILRVFRLFGIETIVAEESRKVGKVRHFVIQKGYRNVN
jgi:hypothetical protein